MATVADRYDIEPHRLSSPTLGAWRRQYGVAPTAVRAGLVRRLAELDGDALARAVDAELHDPGRPALVHRASDVAAYLAAGGRLDVAASQLEALAALLRRAAA